MKTDKCIKLVDNSYATKLEGLMCKNLRPKFREIINNS